MSSSWRLSATVMLAVALGVAHGGWSQTLYGVSSAPVQELYRVDPRTCAYLSTIGTVTMTGDTVGMLRGMAMDPATGTMFVIAFGNNANYLCMIDLTTAALTVVANYAFSEYMRDLTFDAAGHLYAVTGSQGTHHNTLLLLDTTTGGITVKTTVSGTTAHGLAFDPRNPGVLYHRYGTTGLETIDIASNVKTPIGASPAAANIEYGMVWDPIARLFRTCDDGSPNNWLTLTEAGVRVDTGSNCTNSLFGLAYDWDTTAFLVFGDGFETGDTSAWSSVVP